MEKKKKKEGIANIIFSIISIFISFVIVFLAKCTSVEGGLSIQFFKETLADSSFWLVSSVISIAVVFIYLNFYSMKKAKNFKDSQFEEKLKTYNERLKLKPANFNDFIRENNLEEKTRIYKEIINDKITKLELKYMKIKNEKLNGNKALILNKKIFNLKEKIEDSYIKKNIIHIKIKYNELHAANYRKNNFSSIINERKDFSNESNLLVRNGIWKFISSFITIAALNILVVNAFLYLKLDIGFWIIMCSTLFLMINNAFWGIKLSIELFKTEIDIPLENKIIILEKSVAWANGTPDKTIREVLKEFVDIKEKEVLEKVEQEKVEQEKVIIGGNN